MPSKVIPEEHRRKMVQDYIDGATMQEAADRFGYSYMACSFALDKYGVPKRSRSEAHRKYDVNEDFFNEIDTEEKAYWLGFLSADGTIRENKVKIGLSVRDKGHVHKFVEALGSEHPIVVRDVSIDDKTYQTAEVTIGSTKMADDLARLGVVPNKSLIISPLANLPTMLARHYWRGAFDGDGGISFSRSRGDGAWTCTLSFTCGKAMVLGFRDFVTGYVDTEASPRPVGNVYRVVFGGKSLPQAIVRILYDGASVYLERKKESAKRLLALPVHRIDRSSITQKQLERLYNELGTWKAVAKQLGTSEGRLWHIKKRVGLL